MELCRRLEIVQTCKIDLYNYYRWILFLIYVISWPFLIVCLHTVHLHGEDIFRLRHDIDTATPRPVPVLGMWVDYYQLKNGSVYVPVGLIKEGMFEALILFFPWNLQVTVLLQLLSDSLITLINLHKSELQLLLKQYKKWRIVIFLVLVTLYSFLLYLAIVGTLTTAFASARHHFLAWLESNVVEVYLHDGINDKSALHPFTSGKYPPYVLNEHFRYLGEDVVFICGYSTNFEPDYRTTRWRKNGAPVELNDRIYINMSIETIDSGASFIKGFRQHILSTLTIKIIEQRDYGIYTCDYINSLPACVHFDAYSPENNKNDKTIQMVQPMSPHAKSGCQPTVHKLAGNCTLSSSICFEEFELRPFAATTKTVQIRPGGILVTEASYKTVANIGDIKVDVTFEGNTDRKGSPECCSLFIKLYWALFRTGSFVDLPISRLLERDFKNNTSMLTMIKYSCICVDSFGIRDYRFYRDHFNAIIKKEEEIEIKHPVSLNIQPRDNGSVPLLGGFSLCHMSDVLLCWCVETLLDNPFYIFYTYDVFILVGFIIIIIVVWVVIKCSGMLIAKPLRRLCFPNCHYILPFTAVQGPPVYINTNNEKKMSSNFDIYLSCSEDDVYDTEIARYVKVLLTNADLTVFDSVEDILPGHLVAHESAEAIKKSRCFVVIASETYINDNYKKMEFAAIQDSIVSRNSVPKECMLIVKVDDCDIVGLHRVPCIHVPTGLKVTFSLDQSSINQFFEWMNTATVQVNRNEATTVSLLKTSGFTVKSVIFLALLLSLSIRCIILINTIHWSEGTTVNVG